MRVFEGDRFTCEISSPGVGGSKRSRSRDGGLTCWRGREIYGSRRLRLATERRCYEIERVKNGE